jgi:hypothetical protein
MELFIAHPTPFQFAISESLHSEVVSNCQRFVNNLTVAPRPRADHAVFFKHANVWDKNGGVFLSQASHGRSSQLAAQLF